MYTMFWLVKIVYSEYVLLNNIFQCLSHTKCWFARETARRLAIEIATYRREIPNRLDEKELWQFTITS